MALAAQASSPGARHQPDVGRAARDGLPDSREAG
jgi:hypothetical protein